MEKFRHEVPVDLVALFEKRGYDMNDIRETSDYTYRVKSAYGPGDFRVMKNGLIENTKAGFIGREDKVCYVKHLDPKNDYEVVYEEMI